MATTLTMPESLDLDHNEKTPDWLSNSPCACGNFCQCGCCGGCSQCECRCVDEYEDEDEEEEEAIDDNDWFPPKWSNLVDDDILTDDDAALLSSITDNPLESLYAVPGCDAEELCKIIDRLCNYIWKLRRCESPIEKEFFKAAFYEIDGLLPQCHVGNFRADFGVVSTRVVIELDGHDYHKTREQRTNDAQRQRWLEINGWRVIRFTGSEINRNVKQCVREAVKFIESVT